MASGTRKCSYCHEPGHNIATCPAPKGHAVLNAMDDSEGYWQFRPNCTICSWVGEWTSDRDAANAEAWSHHEDTR